MFFLVVDPLRCLGGGSFVVRQLKKLDCLWIFPLGRASINMNFLGICPLVSYPSAPLGDKGEDPQTIMFFFQLSNHNCFTPSPTGFPILWPVALARQRKLYFYLELNQLLKELDHRLKLQGPRDTNPETSHCKKRNIEK